MPIVISQKDDIASVNSGELFNAFFFRAKHVRFISEGDVFVYYHGNRSDRDRRYYYGVGTIGEILTVDSERYCAKLIHCRRFEKKVPIWLPDGSFIEQLSDSRVRDGVAPSWQSSARPISQKAFNYILNVAGLQQAPNISVPAEALTDNLKAAIRDYFVKKDLSSIHRIGCIAASISRVYDTSQRNEVIHYTPSETSVDRVAGLLEYCRTMKMTYSYKAVLILAVIHSGKNGSISIEKAAAFFRKYYSQRREQGLPAEKKRCIYLQEDISDAQIVTNLLANPVKALCGGDNFYYNLRTKTFSLSPEIWSALDRGSKAALTKICRKRLATYFEDP